MSTTPTAQLWAIHLQHEDEWHAAPSERAAKDRAQSLNDWATSHGIDPDVTAKPYPFGEERHAESLKKWKL